MTNVEMLEERREIKPLKLLLGGKGPPSKRGDNWLSLLDKGTAFSCRKDVNNYGLEIFIIAFKYDKTIILVDGLNNATRFAVDPEAFSKRFTYWETIGMEEGDNTPEKNNGNGSQIRPSGMANDADA